MRSSCSSNHDYQSLKSVNLSEPDPDNLLENDIANRSIYFQIEAPEDSNELFSEQKKQTPELFADKNNNQYNQYQDSTDEKMYLCLELTPTISHTKKGYEFETREEKLKRYRQKKVKRVWNRKINYVSRQSVAKQRPRDKGRFINKSKKNPDSFTEEVVNPMGTAESSKQEAPL